MTDSTHKPAVEQKQEHGSMQAYVAGFILSLLFTFLAYYLVVNKAISGMTLLVTIMGFAVLQMIVQVTFFLHLARGPKPNWNLVFFVSTIGIILVIVGGSIIIMNNLHYNLPSADQTKKLINDEAIYQIGGEKTGACQGTKVNHRVTIKDGQVSPAYTMAQLCDTLTFINEDTQLLDVYFGTQVLRETYAGEAEVEIPKGRSETITLSELGTYQFYDQVEAKTSGSFTVSQ